MIRPLSNRAIADLLEQHGQLLEISGESPFRTRAFARAAESLRQLDEPVSELEASGRLREIPGVGPGIAAAISQILSSGDFSDHESLVKRYPGSLVELIGIPGIGAKTALKLYTSLGVENIDSLDAALASNEIARSKGLGPRVDTAIREGLASLRRRSGRTPLGVALPIAYKFISRFKRVNERDLISLAGAARRWEVTVGDLDFVVASQDFSASIGQIGELAMVSDVLRPGPDALEVTLDESIKADIYLVDPRGWGTALVRATGSAQHLERLGRLPNDMRSEEAVYGSVGLPWIPPELRAGNLEFQQWAAIPSLVEQANINGELHTHTTWSDGIASIAEMAGAAAERNYEFLGITDHSQSLGVAGGLSVERLKAQRNELESLNAALALELLAGAEVEVHRDGTLDFDDLALQKLDVVVASLHTGLRQPQDELTNRLVSVLENRNVDIIAHPSGRLIERREGGDFEWSKVFAKAAETGTALEINADPARLDLDPLLAHQARLAGCLITINCDAHRPDGFDVMTFGIAMARRAWLTPDRILNCWPKDQVLEWLSSRGAPS